MTTQNREIIMNLWDNVELRNSLENLKLVYSKKTYTSLIKHIVEMEKKKFNL